MNLVFRKCSYFFEVVVKGGNFYFLLNMGVRKMVDYNIINVVYFVLCIILKLKYLILNLKVIVNINMYLLMLDVILFFYFIVL